MGEKLLNEQGAAQRVDEVTSALEQLTGTIGQEEELAVAGHDVGDAGEGLRRGTGLSAAG
ncbi:hypothetical protein AB0L41_49730 [Amycolatopsis mediterranei]|uniref:hypothetical protein n=1 Tax=Amycolatopsis mediterranei TaxID=33910 RepID=UPI003446380E